MSTTTKKPIFHVTDLRSIVLKADPDHEKPDIEYQFKNGRKFESNDRNGHGLYQDPE